MEISSILTSTRR